MKSLLYQVITGERSGGMAHACRWLLAAAEWPYRAVVSIRNAWYDFIPASSCQAALPVVSVGNLTVGGTGKTPCVALLARHLQSRGCRVAVLSRGYRALADGANDEARELALLVPDIAQRQQPDRTRAAEAVFAEDAADVLILDDGFQHRRLRRDLDIVLVDATRPDGYGHVLPRGLLREPVAGIRRADAVILTRSDAVSPSERTALREKLLHRARHAIWVEACEEPSHLVDCQGKIHDLTTLQEQPVAAFCGIGNPIGFQRCLHRAAMRVERFRPFPDHHHYSAADIQHLTAWSAAPPSVSAIVCTRKDLVKLNSTTALGQIPLLALAVEFCVTTGWQELEQRLVSLASRTPGDRGFGEVGGAAK